MVGNDKKRMQVSITKALLSDIQDYCRYTGISVSDFLSMAAALYLRVDPTTPEDAELSRELEHSVDAWQADKMVSEGF